MNEDFFSTEKMFLEHRMAAMANNWVKKKGYTFKGLLFFRRWATHGLVTVCHQHGEVKSLLALDYEQWGIQRSTSGYFSTGGVGPKVLFE